MLLRNLKLVKLNEVSSTNDYLKENYLKYPSLTVVSANYQTKGRGQFERTWESNINENLLTSFLLKDVSINNISFIKQVVIDTLVSYLSSINIKGIFKEPNDIYVNNKKILGILIETKVSLKKDSFDYVIIGIGLNVNQKEFINPIATSIYNELNKELILGNVLKEIIDLFIQRYNIK